MTNETSYYADLYRRFEGLPKGAVAPMRRVARPDDLRDIPGLYRLFPGARPSDDEVNAAFVLPWCKKQSGGKKLGPACADRIGEARIIQIARALNPDDLIALRRLVIHLQPELGWMEVAPLVCSWCPESKREFVEAYYIVLHKLEQGAKA
jgi:CRISPR system Cascade subunit CasB